MMSLAELYYERGRKCIKEAELALEAFLAEVGPHIMEETYTDLSNTLHLLFATSRQLNLAMEQYDANGGQDEQERNAL